MFAHIQAPLDKQLAISLRQVKLCPVLCLICWLFHSQLSKLTHISKQVPCCCVFHTKVEYTQKQVAAYFFGSLLGVYFSLLFFSFVDLYSSVGFFFSLSSGLVSW